MPRPSDKAPQIRFGVLGTGSMAHGFARDLAHAPGCRLQAVASRRPERARAFADALGAARACTSIEDLAGTDDVDIVSVATVNRLHAEDMMACIAQDTPVLGEKPFTVRGEEARSVASAARARGVFCMEAMWTRFLPATIKAFDLIRAGTIGELVDFDARVFFPRVRDPADWRFDPGQGGGALLDLGVYPISLAIKLLGAPKEVVAQSQLDPSGADERTTVLLKWNQASATISCGLTQRHTNDAVFIGTHGLVRLREPMMCSSLVELVQWQPPTAPNGRSRSLGKTRLSWPLSYLRSARATLQKLRPSRSRRFVRLYRGYGFHYQAEEAARCLRAGAIESEAMRLDESIAVLDVVDRARGCLS